jgi:hypothetical protein
MIPRRNFFPVVFSVYHGVSYPAGQNSAGSQTSQNYVMRGLRPCRSLFCGVSDPVKICSAGYRTTPTKRLKLHENCAGYETPQKFVPRGRRLRRNLIRGVSDPGGPCSAGSQTPQEFWRHRRPNLKSYFVCQIL